MQTWIIFALVSMFLSGMNAILFKVAPNIDAVTLTLVNFAAATVATFIVWIGGFVDREVSVPGVLWGVAAGVSSMLLLIAFIKALQLAPASYVNTIRGLSAAVTVILAIIFLGEKITLAKGSGIVLAIIAGILLTI